MKLNMQTLYLKTVPMRGAPRIGYATRIDGLALITAAE
jgi:hypothetical protein